MLEQGEQLNLVIPTFIAHYLTSSYFQSHLPLRMVTEVGVDHAPVAAIASSVSPADSAPVSAPIPAVLNQLGSASIPGPLAENPPMVSVHVSLTIVVANDAHLALVSEHP